MKLYVSPRGADGNPGTREKPLRTVEEAPSRVPASSGEALTVELAAGEYRTTGVTLEKRAGALTLIGEEGAYPALNGGVRLDPAAFEPLTDEERERLHGEAKNRVIRTDLKKLGLTPDDWGRINAIGTYNTANKYDENRVGPIWCELFVNNSRMEPARYPNTGYLTSGAVIREGEGLERNGKPKRDPAEWAAMRNPLGDIFEIDGETAERMRRWKTLDEVWLFGYPRFGWADASTPIASFDADRRQLEMRYVSLYGMSEHFPYYLFNVFEELDVPGEWYLDRESGMLYLYPPVDPEEWAGADVCLSLMTGPLITGIGADSLTLKGLTFLGTRGSALNLSGNGITVEDCRIRNVGGSALHLTGSDCRVEKCEVCHTGQGGIHANGGDRNSLTPSGIVITNNHIHHIAEIFRTYQPGVSLSGCGIVCSHNCIHHSAHMAIGFGGNLHVMEYNEIYEVCLIADDSSAIYAGRNYTTCGNLIRYNFFHDMRSEADSHIGIFGVYCDDNLGQTDIIGNVFLRCQSALLLHGGHDITFRNNLIVDGCPKSQFSLRFHPYGYWDDLLPGGSHAQGMAQVDWRNETWTKAFPHLAEYLTWDPETEQRYPHYCRLTENIIERHLPIDVRFDCHDERWHNDVGNNPELAEHDGLTVAEDGSLTIDNERLTQLAEGFLPIPFSEIGLLS